MAPRKASKPTVVAQVIEIARDVIAVDPGQVRQDANEGVQDLAASFQTGAAIPPVLVTDLGGGRYRLVDGERRWLAAGIAGLTHLPCLVQPPKGYLETRIEQAQRNNALPMTPLEWAHASYNAYLAANVAALAAEQGVPDPTEGLLDAGLKATEQREQLESFIGTLAGMPVATYLTSRAVRVPRKTVFERLGKPTSETAIKKLWAPLKLSPDLLDALEGTSASGRTLGDLAALPADEQDVAVAAAAAVAAAGGDFAAALRDAVPIRSGSEGAPAAAPPESGDDPEASLDWPEPDAAGDGLEAVTLANGERGDGFVPDPTLALPFGGGAGGKGAMHVAGPEPGRGSVPPAGFGQHWSPDLVTQFHAGLEALLTTLDAAGSATLDEAQQRALSACWGELIERAARAGLETGVPR